MAYAYAIEHENPHAQVSVFWIMATKEEMKMLDRTEVVEVVA